MDERLVPEVGVVPDDWHGLFVTFPRDVPPALVGESFTVLGKLVNRFGRSMELQVARDMEAAAELHISPAPKRRPGSPKFDKDLELDTEPDARGGTASWQVQLRFSVTEHTRSDDLLYVISALIAEDRDGFVDDLEEEGGEMCCYLYGEDPELLAKVAAAAAAYASLGDEAHIVTRDLRGAAPAG